jgi:HK97 family phage major capsid protein
VDSELLFGLADAEEQELLWSDGTGARLLGMVPQAQAYAPPVTITGATMIDTIGLAMLQAALNDLLADGVILHPSDFTRMRLLKNAQGEYLLGPPGADVTPIVFGLPCALSTAMQVDKFLLGAFQASTRLYDRWAPQVHVSTEGDWFLRNEAVLLAEERIGLGVSRPEGLIFGDFGNVT